jgi:hypothetical protein
MSRMVGSCGLLVCAVAGIVAAFPGSASAASSTGPLGLVITAGPSGTVASRTATFAFTANAKATSFTCSLDGGAPAPCDDRTITYSDLADGDHSFLVAAAAGQTVADRAARSWIVAVPPDTRIDSGPAPTVRTTTAVFTFSAVPEATSFECSLDGATFAPCASPETYEDLARARHTFAVRAVTAVGSDPTPATAAWEVLAPPPPPAAPPDTRIVTAPTATTHRATATLVFASVPAGATFECSLDGAAFVPCPATLTTAALRGGQHRLAVRSVSAAGRDPTPAVASWTFVPVAVVPQDGGGGGWRLPAAIVAALVAAAAALALAARFRLRARRLEWQLEASEEEPHGPCRAGRHIQRELTLKPSRRSIAHLDLDAQDRAGRAIGRRVEGAPVDGLNDSVRAYRGDRRISPELRVALLPVATALVTEIEEWLGPQAVDRQDVLVRAHLEGGKAEWKFTPWRCVRGEWKAGRSWTVEVEDERDVAAARVSHPYPPHVAAEVLLSQLSAFVAEVDVTQAGRPPESAPVLHG